MMRLINKYSIMGYLYPILLVLFFVVEAINKIQYYYTEDNFFLQKIIKGLCLLAILGMLAVKSKTKLIGLFVISVGYFLSNITLENSFTGDSILGFQRYFFFLAIVMLAPSLDIDKKKIVSKIFEGIVIINSVLIIISGLFQLDIFATYQGERFGYNGLFMANSSSSYFYIITFMYYLLGKKYYFQKVGFWLALIASMLVGTKSIYIAVLLLTSLTAICFVKNKKQRLIILGGLFIFALIFIVVFFSSGIFSRILEEEGWLTALLSHRDKLLLEKTIPYIQDNWSFMKYLFGGLSNPFLRPQLEIIDLFLYFGLLGMPIYLFLFFNNYFCGLKLDFFEKGCFGILFLSAIIAGNFFYNASVPIYLLVLRYTLIDSKHT